MYPLHFLYFISNMQALMEINKKKTGRIFAYPLAMFYRWMVGLYVHECNKHQLLDLDKQCEHPTFVKHRPRQNAKAAAHHEVYDEYDILNSENSRLNDQYNPLLNNLRAGKIEFSITIGILTSIAAKQPWTGSGRGRERGLLVWFSFENQTKRKFETICKSYTAIPLRVAFIFSKLRWW